MIKKERFNVMLNPFSVSIIDKYAVTLGMSRSELIDKLLLQLIVEENLQSLNSDIEIDGQLEVI